MSRASLLVDTDVFIDFFNTGRFSDIFASRDVTIYYSVVTRKELLSKAGLRDTERRSISTELRRFRMIPLNAAIASRYSTLRAMYPSLEKEDALIAATALSKRLPLFTLNRRHFKSIEGLTLLGGRAAR